MHPTSTRCGVCKRFSCLARPSTCSLPSGQARREIHKGRKSLTLKRWKLIRPCPKDKGEGGATHTEHCASMPTCPTMYGLMYSRRPVSMVMARVVLCVLCVARRKTLFPKCNVCPYGHRAMDMSICHKRGVVCSVYVCGLCGFATTEQA